MAIFECDGKIITVDDDCAGCGVCEGSCPCGILQVIDGKCTAPLIAECCGCKTCEGSCPQGSIKVGF
ncbi:4Fe-4S ferredoxin-type domain-containing protein [Entamoeba marina]